MNYLSKLDLMNYLFPYNNFTKILWKIIIFLIGLNSRI